jgi:3-deoxy-manno-octulosonate cytidylyltransferase (CMP-KDO synthetase)
MNRAKESEVGEVLIATPDAEIVEVVEKNQGKAILTKDEHKTGSDRIYEVFSKIFNKTPDIIINLQGDMPNIKPDSISKLNKFMQKNDCDIGTLAGICKNESEMINSNIVKVEMDEELNNERFLIAKDFFRIINNKKNRKIYHHIGCYAFTGSALSRYIKLPRSKKEIERNLEQMRAMENNLTIKVALSDSIPLGVDTKEELQEVTEEMSK